jgi:hypothetical protein
MAALYTHTTRATGTILTATIYNTDHQNHIDNGIPTMLDDYSSNATEMRTQTDPGESGSESLPTNLAGELARLRYAIAELKGTTYWYQTADTDVNTLKEDFDGTLPRNYISGLKLTNDGGDTTNDINVGVGECSTEDDTDRMTLSTDITKRLDATWAVGDNQGGMESGTSLDNQAYYVWLIKRSDTGVVDVLFSASSTAPTMPTNYDMKRRIGAIMRKSGAILQFIQRGNYFHFATPQLDVDITNPGTSRVDRTLSSIPGGFPKVVLFNAYTVNSASVESVVIAEPTQLSLAPSATAAPLSNLLSPAAGVATTGRFELMCGSNIISTAHQLGNANTTFRIASIGWIDFRKGVDLS